MDLLSVTVYGQSVYKLASLRMVSYSFAKVSKTLNHLCCKGP